LVETSPSEGVSAEYLKLNKLGKVPTFEGADGFVLSESVAIAVYREYPTPFLAASYDVECFYHSVIPV
jgi:glutathione S-transferase